MGTTKLYIGLNDKDTKKQEITANKARAKVISKLFEYGFENFTFEIVEGVYKHKDGKVVIENTIVITLCSDDNPFEITQYEIETLKRELNQECIMVEQYESIIKFI